MSIYNIYLFIISIHTIELESFTFIHLYFIDLEHYLRPMLDHGHTT